MGKIQVLDKRMAELIAAGEVIDRPASVAKELCENAIDAGARKITVEIQRGGIAYLRVTDDGGGIQRDDIRRAFLRHATSKLHEPDDLQNILTMGFRGEALASVAAMSRVEALTRAPQERGGVHYRIEGGEEMGLEETGCPAGTTLVVRDLFYNTPARMKFLKKDASEGGAVAAVVDKMAISHPEIAFQFIRDGKPTLQTPGNGRLGDAVYAVYGREFYHTLVPLQFDNKGVRVRGLISRPAEGRGNRTMQHFFVNGRSVRSRICMAALEEGYRSSIMKGRFPACVLDILIPPSVYDINVHPAKLEVRFADEKLIFDAVYYGVKSALLGLDAQGVAAPLKETPKLPPAQLELRQDIVKEGDTLRIDSASYQGLEGKTPLSDLERLFSKNAPIPAQAHPAPDQTGRAAPLEFFPMSGAKGGSAGERREPPAAASFTVESAGPSGVGERAPASYTPPEERKEGAPRRYDGAVLLGELFKTYILMECEDKLILIDKHAAHERLLYEKLRASAAVSRQVLLSPVTVTLPKEEYALVLQNFKLLEDLGFGVEDFGQGCVLVREIPTMLPIETAAQSVLEIADSLLMGNGRPSVEAMEELYHSMACKAAVKAHDENAPAELAALVELLNEHEDVRFCPHGRPIATVMTRRQLEKMFGRV